MGRRGPVTATYRIDEAGELVPVELGEVTAHGPALVIRAGGGRVGRELPVAGRAHEHRPAPGLRRVPRRRHRLARPRAADRARGEHWYLDDCGSLNGTYVNRSRIESQRLEEGDEVQIGKYKLTFHAR